ncbi:DUF4304 domain-containing protein (plasmid) [Methylomonas sp. HW2-6]|uniref:DUF4304 domain-containing protein n=1 Tax=Methylomonas sp. HW2-6 TaxID=3376687 RepID=UPI004041DBD2
MTKIQDTFKYLLKDSVAPKLREYGLKGSGQNYTIKSDKHWALIGLQKSMFSDSNGLKFTINLYVVPKEDWESARQKLSYLPVKPSANIHWPVGWVKRIGYLMPQGEDYWWSVDSTTNLQGLVSEVVDAICNKAIPAIQQQINNS